MSIFDGTWQIDLRQSIVLDEIQNQYMPDQVGQETITIKTFDNTQVYTVQYGDSPAILMGYTATFDDPAWVPYEIREIVQTEPGDLDDQVEQFADRIKASSGYAWRDFRVGERYARIRLIALDDRTHVRLSRIPNDDKAQNLMLRRMDASGDRYVASVVHPDGRVHRIRHFVRHEN